MDGSDSRCHQTDIRLQQAQPLLLHPALRVGNGQVANITSRENQQSNAFCILMRIALDLTQTYITLEALYRVQIAGIQTQGFMQIILGKFFVLDGKQRMLSPAEQAMSCLIERQVIQILTTTIEETDRQMQATIQHLSFQVSRITNTDIDTDAGGLGQEYLESIGHPKVRIGDRIINDSQIDLTTELLSDVTSLIDESVYRRQQSLGTVQQLSAFRCQAEPGIPSLA